MDWFSLDMHFTFCILTFVLARTGSWCPSSCWKTWKVSSSRRWRWRSRRWGTTWSRCRCSRAARAITPPSPGRWSGWEPRGEVHSDIVSCYAYCQHGLQLWLWCLVFSAGNAGNVNAHLIGIEIKYSASSSSALETFPFLPLEQSTNSKIQSIQIDR